MLSGNLPVQTLQVAAMQALNSVIFGLVHYYPEDEFEAADCAGVEPFLDKKGRPLNNAPRWHDPSPAEVGAFTLDKHSRR